MKKKENESVLRENTIAKYNGNHRGDYSTGTCILVELGLLAFDTYNISFIH